jgi:hypothetical protein
VKPDRREKFVEIAEKRVNRTLTQISLIGNLSNRSNYSYTQENVAEIYNALRKALDEMKGRFDAQTSDKEPKFQLKK